MMNTLEGYHMSMDDIMHSIPKDVSNTLLATLIPEFVMEVEDNMSEAYIVISEQQGLQESARYTNLPVKDVIAVGSRAEKTFCPRYFKRPGFDNMVYDADTDLMFIVDSAQLEYDIEIKEIDKCYNYIHLNNSLTKRHISHWDVLNDASRNMKRKGPALYEDTEYKDERVVSISFNTWPKHIVDEWTIRSNMGWPTYRTKSLALSEPFCVVPVGRKNSTTYDSEWRYSFSLSEVVLMNSITSKQRCAYRLVKLLYSCFKNQDKIPSYLIKTIFLNMLESTPPGHWDCELLFNINRILDQIINVFRKKDLKHYFVRNVNLLSNLTDDECIAVISQTQNVKDNVLGYILNFHIMFKFQYTPSSISESVPSFNCFLSHPQDPCDWDKMIQQWLDTLMEFIVGEMQSWIKSAFRIDPSKITKDEAETALNCHNFNLAASYLVEVYHSFKHRSNYEIVKWIILHVLKYKYGKLTRSVTLSLVCLYVNNRHNGIYLDMNLICAQHEEQILAQQLDRSQMDEVFNISMAIMPLVVQSRIDIGEFVLHIWLLWKTFNDTNSTTKQIAKNSRSVISNKISVVRYIILQSITFNIQSKYQIRGLLRRVVYDLMLSFMLEICFSCASILGL